MPQRNPLTTLLITTLCFFITTLALLKFGTVGTFTHDLLFFTLPATVLCTLLLIVASIGTMSSVYLSHVKEKESENLYTDFETFNLLPKKYLTKEFIEKTFKKNEIKTGDKS